MTTFYDEQEGCHVYPIRCDKHNFKPFEYCEMCYIKSRLQSVVEEARKDVQFTSSQLCISANDLFDSHQKLKEKVKELEKLVVK